MSKDNIIIDKTFAFSIRIVNLYKILQSSHKEFILSKQLLRSGTSIGVNVNEAQAAHAGAMRLNPAVKRGQSTKDFLSKLSIASKEARETKYWIDLLVATNFINKNHKSIQSLLSDIDEINKLLTSIIKTTQERRVK